MRRRERRLPGLLSLDPRLIFQFGFFGNSGDFGNPLSPPCSSVSFVVKGFSSRCSTQSPPAGTLPSYASSTQSGGICLACVHASENSGSRIQIQSLSVATGPAPSPAPPRNPDTLAVSSAPQSPASAPPLQTETARPARWSAPASGGHPPSEAHRPARPSSTLAAKLASCSVSKSSSRLVPPPRSSPAF